jgi:hypothetical protein
MAAELVDRLAILVAVRGFPIMGVADSRSLRLDIYVHMHHLVRLSTFVSCGRFWGDVRREFMQRNSTTDHDTLVSYLRDALHEGDANVVACLPILLAYVGVFMVLYMVSNGIFMVFYVELLSG